MSEIKTSDPAVIELHMQRWSTAQARSVVTKCAELLYDYTPVDTGYARGNWVISLGSPETSEVGSKESVDESRYRGSFSTLNAWTEGSAFISNSVPYIGRLNAGWSTQAPAGFIESAIEQGIATAPEVEDF